MPRTALVVTAVTFALGMVENVVQYNTNAKRHELHQMGQIHYPHMLYLPTRLELATMTAISLMFSLSNAFIVRLVLRFLHG